MARAMAIFTVALALFAVTAAVAREAPLGQEKTYAPPYGTDPGTPYSPPAVVSPVVPTPVDPAPYVPTPIDPVPTPYTPTDPAPTTPTPSTPGTCSWWSSNTGSFPDLITTLSTLVDLFSALTGGSGGSGGSGIASIIGSIFGSQMTVMQGLTNTRTDGYGALARQSSAALLNSFTRRDFAYSPFQVKLQFRNALGSQQQALQVATLFENANLALGARRH